MPITKSNSRKQLQDLSFTLEDNAFVLFATRYDIIEFAVRLNHLYDLRLWREEDILLTSDSGFEPCAFYSCMDSRRGLFFALIDNPYRNVAGFSVTEYDKILVINGRDAFDMQMSIYEDCCTLAHRSVREGDYLGLQFEARRYNFVSEGIILTEYFDFRSMQLMQDCANGDGQFQLKGDDAPSVIYSRAGLDYKQERARTMALKNQHRALWNDEEAVPRSSIVPGVGDNDRLSAKRRKYLLNMAKLSIGWLNRIELHLFPELDSPSTADREHANVLTLF